jgi:LmbE family N-acetylglucosaminyl deacetylase
MAHPDESWVEKQKILILLAHPDDPEFFLGATIARWIHMGHEINYCLFTKGDKGSDDVNLTPEVLSNMRVVEQRRAAEVLGVSNVEFLDYKDGYLVPDLSFRREVVRIIRKEKPDVIVTSDPTNIFPRVGAINHPDHRAAGQVVVDAVFPAAGNVKYFPELLEEGYKPHSIKEIWLSVTGNPNVIIDVTEYWDKKIQALLQHASQIGDSERFRSRMLSRHTPESTMELPRFEERFYRISYR